MGRLAGMGVRSLFLEVDEGNAAARRLYERAGFAEVGRRKAYYQKADGSAATALVMKRTARLNAAGRPARVRVDARPPRSYKMTSVRNAPGGSRPRSAANQSVP